MARAALSTLPRFAALASLLITVAGFVVIVAGLAKLQQTTNRLGAIPQDTAADSTYTQYNQAINGALITPYPANHHFQFAFIWFIIFGNLFTVLYCAAVLAVPALHVGRGAALAFLAIFTTLTINVVNNLVFFYKAHKAGGNIVAQTYSMKHINVTLAGALLVVLGHVFTILTLGFWEPWRTLFTTHNNNYYGTNKTATTTPTTGVAQAQTTV